MISTNNFPLGEQHGAKSMQVSPRTFEEAKRLIVGKKEFSREQAERGHNPNSNSIDGNALAKAAGYGKDGLKESFDGTGYSGGGKVGTSQQLHQAVYYYQQYKKSITNSSGNSNLGGQGNYESCNSYCTNDLQHKGQDQRNPMSDQDTGSNLTSTVGSHGYTGLHKTKHSYPPVSPKHGDQKFELKDINTYN
jgi:hypothetical protein